MVRADVSGRLFAERPAAFRVAQQANDGGGELVGAVGQQQLAALADL